MSLQDEHKSPKHRSESNELTQHQHKSPKHRTASDGSSQKKHDSPKHKLESEEMHHTSRVGTFENRAYSVEEHHEWALKLWNRMDRDGSGSITREELNCEEFQDVLHTVIAPENTNAHAQYGRAEMHIDQALDFCLRKATLNSDGTLSFKEFESFMRMLRNQGDEHNKVHLIFALFDLDCSGTIDKDEFEGIYRFFSGHNPCLVEVQRSFEQMDKFDKKEVTRNQFIRWLKTDAPQEFKQHAGTVEADLEEEKRKEAKLKKAKPTPKKIHRPAPGLLPRADSVPTFTNSWHCLWNERFRGRDHTLMNPVCPERMKHYFSAPQTLPELNRFYKAYSGFEGHKTRLNRPPSPIRRPIVSTQSKQLEVNPERAAPGGTAKSSKGDLIAWDNDWPDKASDFKNKVKPGTLMFRCQKPPPILLLGRDADHIAYRAKLATRFALTC